jgi:hypothetical protein
LFDEKNYATWSIIMRIYFRALGFDILELVKTIYIDKDGKESSEKYEKAMEVILSGLPNYDVVKVIKCTKTK